jgi:hypothetical protein
MPVELTPRFIIPVSCMNELPERIIIAQEAKDHLLAIADGRSKQAPVWRRTE